MERVSVIGLGAMGAPMAARLAGAGLSVRGFDRDAAKREACPWAVERFAEALDADALILSLPNSAVVEAVTAEALATARPGLLIVDTSTADPASTRRLQAQAAAQGVGFVDAPVSGGAKGAAEGRLLVMLGGAPDDRERARAVLAPLARAVLDCGGPGAGNVVKLINNLLCSAHLLLAGEALRMGEAAGLDAETLAAALAAGSGRSGAIEANLPAWVLNGAYDSGFTLGLMGKDVGLAAALDGLGPLAGATLAQVAAARARFADGEDFNRLVDAAWRDA
ncbi:MAG: NAD(P)-dependent oxidoreductase [Rhodobacteraceae bacterium]|nr:MAG: NAD(P)-dependent oxidoreductase [Paracoccaceae bacterium]